MRSWRHNFTGVRAEHAPTGLTLFGAIDDLWVNHGGTHFVVDYKATSKRDEVDIDADWQGGCRRQVEFYQNENPSAARGTPPRRSIEVRTILYFAV